MSLVPFTNTIAAATLNANFDDLTSTIAANALVGKKDGEIPFRLASLAAGADISLRSIAWTQMDDQEVRVLALRVTDTAAGRVVTARLTVDNDDDRFLGGFDVEVSVTTINGTVNGYKDMRTVTGERIRLLRGVRYRLEIENTTGATTVAGPLQVVLQVRSRRRSEGLRTQIPFVPRRFIDTTNLDPEAINDNLDRIARNVQAGLDQRYTYSPPIFLPLDGVTNASDDDLRAFAIRRQAAAVGLEVVAYELVIFATADIDWTLTPSDTSMPPITVTGAGSTEEAHAILEMPGAIPSASADVVMQAAASGVSTITRGYIVVHLRADRGDQGLSHASYTPTLVDASSSKAGALLDTALAGLAAAAARDTANDKDVRVECFAVRGVASGTTVSLLLPSGARRILGTVAYIVGGVGTTATVTVTGTGLSGSSVAVVGTGATNRVAGADSASGTMNDDPTDSADDATVAIAISGGGTASLVYVLVFWS